MQILFISPYILLAGTLPKKDHNPTPDTAEKSYYFINKFVSGN